MLWSGNFVDMNSATERDKLVIFFQLSEYIVNYRLFWERGETSELSFMYECIQTRSKSKKKEHYNYTDRNSVTVVCRFILSYLLITRRDGLCRCVLNLSTLLCHLAPLLSRGVAEFQLPVTANQNITLKLFGTSQIGPRHSPHMYFSKLTTQPPARDIVRLLAQRRYRLLMRKKHNKQVFLRWWCYRSLLFVFSSIYFCPRKSLFDHVLGKTKREHKAVDEWGICCFETFGDFGFNVDFFFFSIGLVLVHLSPESFVFASSLQRLTIAT